MPSFGFHYRYRLNGGPPSIRRFARAEAEGLAPGDVVTLDAGAPRLAATGDVTFLGCVLEPQRGVDTSVDVVADEDAVYGVADPKARTAGTNLDLAGGSSAQTVTESVNDDFEVVVDSTAEEETLLRITLGRHWAFTVAIPRGGTAVPGTALTPARERRLVMAAAAGDEPACAELVETFLPAIARLAGLYRGARMVDRSDLLQEGVVGLLRATRRFDPSLGTPFWAYASWWVRQAMQQLVSELSRPLVLSDRAQRGLARIREARRTFAQTQAREPSTDELAALVELPREHVERLLAAEQSPQPLAARVAVDDERGGTVEDRLVDPAAEDEYERILSRLEIERVRDLTEMLTARQRSILHQHYGLDGAPRTLRAIGQELGLSAERVRQIEEQALETIRTAVTIGAAA